jgi:radical SAM superfamily enzyme YgiQ (UPF0313 family)
LGYKVVLTCERTMASNYHGLVFLGFSACLPQGTVPDWLYYPLFCPSAPVDSEGRLLYANYGTRKIEAALLSDGFQRDDVIVAHPNYLHKVIDSDTKIVAISSNDPLGIGPATSTFVELWGGEGRMAVKLRELLNHPAIRKHKPIIFLGGPGAWQFSVHPEKQKELGIHCVVVGEGEITAPKLFQLAIKNNNSNIPNIVQGEVAWEENIPDIVDGSTIGIIEVTRGCARSCAFCVPTVRKIRSWPLENILNEVQVNIEAGNTGALLHGEDILLYQSDGLKVNSSAVIELFDRVYNANGVKWIGASHASLASAVSSPKTVERISNIIELGTKKHPVNYLQVGIETGSPKLVRRHMKGKAYPFQPEEWPKIVKEGFELFHENRFICCSTIIMGLPREERQDIEQTTELIQSLRAYESMIVPLLFTPMETTRLEYAKPLLKKDLTPQHYELITACWDHNLNWIPKLWEYYGRTRKFLFRNIINLSIKIGTNPIRRRMHKNARKYGASI